MSSPVNSVPKLRVRALNDRPVRTRGDFVLYWMIAHRRARSNFALDRAVDRSRELGRPLVILEALRAGHRWNSARLQRFVIDGMAANEHAFESTGVRYYPYVEPRAGEGSGLVEALAARACLVVTDDFPCYFLPRMTAATAQRVDVCVESIDSNGLLPMRAAREVYPTAYAFRRFLQRNLREHLAYFPKTAPFDGPALVPHANLPAEIERRWPRAKTVHDAEPVLPGGSRAGEVRLESFVRAVLPRYAEERNEPEADASSGLSPYLHFGHLSPHTVFESIARWEGWTIAALGSQSAGKRAGFWGVGESAEAYLDQLVTWRELGFNFCSQRADYDRYESLPSFALATLAKHAADKRPHVYSLDELESAATHDPLWNAAQTELVRTGKMHNYLRMLWGKKILQWSPSPQVALDVMIELNNKFAFDGRDPNSYSGIFWVLGRYDRPWGPERPIFGTVRYMTSENTARKLDVDAYVRRYSGGAPTAAT
jgi:deoxyribodipyrimidine photo-lyase